jgi:Domain of unknown function (DUF1905)
MAGKTSKSAKVASPGELGDSKAASKIRFSATLLRPKATAKAVSWTFLTLPKEASAKLPSRSMTSVEGTFNGLAFQATLEPDGQGGHWLKVDRKMREEAGAEAGDVVTLEIAPVAEEPEPRVPADLRKALAAYASGEPHLQNGSTTCDHVRGTVLPHSPELCASDPRQMVRRADHNVGGAHTMAPSPSGWKMGPGLRGAQSCASAPASRSAFHRSGSSSSIRLAGWVLIRSRTSRR